MNIQVILNLMITEHIPNRVMDIPVTPNLVVV